jgi:SAM-dependent methyltransferase
MEFIKSIPGINWSKHINLNKPKWYIVVNDAETRNMLTLLQDAISSNGIMMQFETISIPVIFFEEYYYWVTKTVRFKNYIINRAKICDLADYINVDSYDGIFDQTYYLNEDRLLTNMIGKLNGSVLDIGCGTGFLLDYINIEDYHGIDPSPAMLMNLVKKHPGKRKSITITSAENHTLTGKTYDNIIALFSGSYIKVIMVFEKLWSRKGTMFLMFYKENYSPVTHKFLNIAPEWKKYSKEDLEKEFSQSVMEFNNYYIVSL